MSQFRRSSYHRSIVFSLAALAFAANAQEPAPAAEVAPYRAELENWRANRARTVVEPGRPLSYTGLTWLRPGRNTIGSGPLNDVVLRGRGVPLALGALVREGATVRFEPADGTSATIDSARAVAGTLRTDAEERPSRVLVGSAGFRIVKRVDSIGVRAWDAALPALKSFSGIPYFPHDPQWRVSGRFVPLVPARKVAVMTESGVPEEHEIVGSVRTTIGGVDYALTAFKSGGARLFITFADASSGEESYGFRFLQALRDTVTNVVTMDFNFAYNPDCAFSPFTTCPLPPPENRIRSKVLAGERAVKVRR
ncbi:MAG: DUF1684 domain-containing protein [Gemmatimonadota bacterium]